MAQKHKVLLLIIVLACLIGIFFSPIKDNATACYLRYIAGLNPGSLKGIPILAYHCIDGNDSSTNSMLVPVKQFERQMKYLYDEGFTPITFEQLAAVKNIKKPIILTFDDGYEDNYKNAYPILKEYDFKATIFLITGAIGKNGHLDIDEIKKMRDLIDFESHTVHHSKLTTLPISSIESELVDSKAFLEKQLNKEVTVLSYPYGAYNKQIVSIAKKYYKYCVEISNFKVYSPPGTYELKRAQIFNDTNMDTFIKLLK